jgi:hypothetical protein
MVLQQIAQRVVLPRRRFLTGLASLIGACPLGIFSLDAEAGCSLKSHWD